MFRDDCVLTEDQILRTWPYAILQASLLHNIRSRTYQHSSLNPKKAFKSSPYKFMYNRNWDYSRRMPIYGTRVFSFYGEQAQINRGKLPSRLRQGIFLGLDIDSMGARIMHSDTGSTRCSSAARATPRGAAAAPPRSGGPPAQGEGEGEGEG